MEPTAILIQSNWLGQRVLQLFGFSQAVLMGTAGLLFAILGWYVGFAIQQPGTSLAVMLALYLGLVASTFVYSWHLVEAFRIAGYIATFGDPDNFATGTAYFRYNRHAAIGVRYLGPLGVATYGILTVAVMTILFIGAPVRIAFLHTLMLALFFATTCWIVCLIPLHMRPRLEGRWIALKRDLAEQERIRRIYDPALSGIIVASR